MRLRIYMCLIPVLLGCACAAGDVWPYRGDDGRTGDYGTSPISSLDQIVWKHRASAPIAGTAAVGHGRVFVSSTDGHLSALDAPSGDVVWDVDLGAASYGTPVVTGHRVIVGTDAGLRAVGLDGVVQWSASSGPVEAAPLIINAVAYVGTRDNVALAVDAVGGSLIWTAAVGGPVTVPAVRVGDDVVFGSADGGVYRLDPATGEPRWSWSAHAPVRGLAAADGRLYVTAGSKVFGLDAKMPDSDPWQFDLGSRVETSPSVSGGILVVGTGAGNLTALSTTDGSQLFRRELTGPIRGEIAFTGNLLLVPTSRAGLEVVDTGGNPIWHFRTDGLLRGVMPAGRRLYVTDSKGSLYVLQ